MPTTNDNPQVQPPVVIDPKLVPLDRKIDKNESTALRARWEFGQLMLAARGGNGRLPNGYLAELVERTGKSRSELKYRAQFAECHPSEAELANALASFSSWRELTQSFSPGSDTVEEKPSREIAAGRRLAHDAELLRTAVAEGLRPEDVDAVRAKLLAARSEIENALADLDAMGAAQRRHPAGKNTRKTAVA